MKVDYQAGTDRLFSKHVYGVKVAYQAGTKALSSKICQWDEDGFSSWYRKSLFQIVDGMKVAYQAGTETEE